MIMLATRPKSTPPVLSLPFDWVPAPRELTTDDVAQPQYRTELWHLTQQVMDELRRRGIEPISAYLNDGRAPHLEVAVLVDSHDVLLPAFAGMYDFICDLEIAWEDAHDQHSLLIHVFGINATFREVSLFADGYHHRFRIASHGSS